MGRRSNISLFGGSSQSYGISLFGGSMQPMQESITLDSYSQEYSDLKTFIYNHLISPLVKKDIDIVNLNSFNFTYITKKLQNFSHMYKDTSIFLKLIDAIRAAIEITNENNKLYEIVYGEVKDTTLLFKTTAVEFIPEIQIYIQIYGKPTEISQFDEHRLHEIQQILRATTTITFEEVKLKLGYAHKKTPAELNKENVIIIAKKQQMAEDSKIKIAI